MSKPIFLKNFEPMMTGFIKSGATNKSFSKYSDLQLAFNKTFHHRSLGCGC